ncbi:MAG: 50S ribosomal protein L29 [Bacteroidetes bacterium HGW-Bacteroidetes-21]|jgi:large subunit ribosomal protein L29|nr:MAG: 50S ribosomal protein L29 [Bacteroidetes bacterium HGW-Bacteroidetes-21]
MKQAEIKQLTTKELRERIIDEKELLTKMKINHTISPLDNPMKIQAVRKNVARLMTEIRKRELETIE